MKFASIAGLLSLAILLGCGTPGVPLPPSLELPQPVQDLRASRKGDTVTLMWTVPRETTDRTTVRLRHLGPTHVCRSLTVGMTQCAEQVAQVDTPSLVSAAEAAAAAKAKAATNNKKKAESTPEKTVPVPANAKDTLSSALQQQHPTGFINYAVETLNTHGRSAGLSNQVQVPLAPTLPPPDDLAAKVTADGVVLTFTGVLHEHEAPELRHKYRLYRQEKDSATPALVGEVQLSTSSQGQLVDHSLEWQKTYQYWVTVVTMVVHNGKASAEVEGDNSAPITVFANDVFPPAVPAGLQAVFSGVGQQPFVDLTWAPNTDPDLAGYNVYRREDNGAWSRINSALAPTPAYRDGNVAAGRTYFYAVTAVDVHGNESARSQETSETVPGND
jgi:fibronectin type 3 domain-containing protein